MRPLFIRTEVFDTPEPPTGSDTRWKCATPTRAPRRRRRPRQPHERLVTGQCSVYLLVHRHDRRFKIGRSQDPWVRGQQLPEANFIEWERSLQCVLPSPARASQVERMLHRALAAFRLNFKPLYLSGWDGSTEWFSQHAFRHAVNILQATPSDGHLSEPMRLLPVQRPRQDASPAAATAAPAIASPDLERAPLSPAQIRDHLAARHNVERMTAILEMLTQLGWEHELHLRDPQTAPQALPARVQIEGLRGHWSGESMRARYAVTDTAQYVFHSAHAQPGRREVSLLRFIRYVTAPTPEVLASGTAAGTPATKTISADLLELELTDLRLIQRLPQGRRIVAQWGLWWQHWQEGLMTAPLPTLLRPRNLHQSRNKNPNPKDPHDQS